MRRSVLQDAETQKQETEKEFRRAMLFTDFAGRQCAIRLELVQRIETIQAGCVDRSGKLPRAVIDGAILPVIGLPQEPLECENLRLLRLSDGACQLLHAVREVQEAIELDGTLQPVTDESLVEAVALVGSKTVNLVDGHELFARFGKIPELTDKPLCRLPEGEWARTILAPLVSAAGYDVCVSSQAGEDIAIWFDEEYEAALAQDAEFKTPVVRLRETPEAREGSNTVYRYDRDGLVEALRQAQSAGASQ